MLSQRGRGVAEGQQAVTGSRRSDIPSGPSGPGRETDKSDRQPGAEKSDEDGTEAGFQQDRRT